MDHHHHHHTGRETANLLQYQPHYPDQSEQNVFKDDAVVDIWTMINQLLSQIFVLSLLHSKEAKVHLEVPEDGIEGGDELDDEPDVENDLLLQQVVEQTGEVGQH